MRIPLLRSQEPITPDYVAALKAAIKSDGCSDSPDIYGSCCVLHDLGYRFGIDAYGRQLKKSSADAMLRRCMQSKSPLGCLSPVSWIYWLGVRYLGWKAYAIDIDDRPSFDSYFFHG